MQQVHIPKGALAVDCGAAPGGTYIQVSFAERDLQLKASYASSTPSSRSHACTTPYYERWGAGVETHKNVRGEIGGWGRVPFNEPYAPSLSTIYDGA